MRALRLLHSDLPHLPAAGRRAGRAPWAHLPDEAGAGRRRSHTQHAAAPRPLPDLPQLRIDLPVGRGLRASGGNRPQHRRGPCGTPLGRKSDAHGAKRRPDLALVRPGHEAGPTGATSAASRPEEQGARTGTGQRPCMAPQRTPPQDVDAGGLRATGHDAQHQQRHRPRAGRRRHPDPGAAPSART
ncbi:MAG: hypothetical protein RLZZ591_1786 [Pseudomonadota bacterium]